MPMTATMTLRTMTTVLCSLLLHPPIVIAGVMETPTEPKTAAEAKAAAVANTVWPDFGR